MSTYTTELRFICEELAGLDKSKDYPDVNSIITIARPKIFNFSYPIFDENYKSVLEHKILKHYYTREICAETYGLWHLWLDDRMNIIMPYYNQLYKSEQLEFNPLHDTDIHTKSDTSKQGNSVNIGQNNETTTNTQLTENLIEKEDTGTETKNMTGTETKDMTGTETTERNVNETGESTLNQTQWDLFNDTPQGGITGIEALNYLTNARKITNEQREEYEKQIAETGTLTRDLQDLITKNLQDLLTKDLRTDISEQGNVNTNGEKELKTSNENNFTNTEDYLQYTYGKSGGVSYSKMLDEYRKTFLNIDAKIIKDLSNLFFNLW